MRRESSSSHEPGRGATWMVFENRATTSVLGFALMFGIVTTTFAIYQADVVPHQNEQVEFEHSQAMAEELGELRSAAQRAGRGVPASATLRTGTAYPERAVGVNGPEPRGRLWTTEAHDVELTGTEPADGAYWTGSGPTFETRLLTARTDYTHIDGPTYGFEYGVPIKQFPNGEQRVVGSPSVIDGTRIDLVLLSGEFDRAGRSTTAEFRPVSTDTNYRTLAEGGELTLPTRLTESEWESLVPSHVTVSVDDSTDPDEVTLDLDDDRSYRLRVTKLKLVGEDGSAARAPVEMLTAETDASPDITPDETTDLTVAARDEYGNPVQGVEVTFTPSDPTIGSSQTVRTGADGRATYPVAPATTVDGSVTASVVGGSASTTFDLNEPNTPIGRGPMAVYTGGQMAEDLGDVDSLTLSEARTVPTSETNCLLLGDTGGGLLGGLLGGLQCDTDDFRTSQGQLQFTADGGEYQLNYALLDEDGDDDVTDGSDKLLVEIEAAASDDTVFAGEVDDSVANDVFNESGVDVFDVSNYDAGTVEWDNDSGCYADCGIFDGTDQTGAEATSPYDDGDGDGGYTSFDDIDLSDTGSIFVEDAIGRVTVTPGG